MREEYLGWRTPRPTRDLHLGAVLRTLLAHVRIVPHVAHLVGVALPESIRTHPLRTPGTAESLGAGRDDGRVRLQPVAEAGAGGAPGIKEGRGLAASAVGSARGAPMGRAPHKAGAVSP